MGKLLKEGLETFSQYIFWKIINFILRPWFLVLWNNLLYASEKYALNVNEEIIRVTFTFLKASQCCAQPLFWAKIFLFTFSIYLFFLSNYLFFLLYLIYIYIYIYIYIHILLFLLYLRTDCKWLYLTWVQCLVSSAVILYNIICFIYIHEICKIKKTFSWKIYKCFMVHLWYVIIHIAITSEMRE